MSVILIGYRGSGKTSVGRELAARVGWPFVDADELIVQRAGMNIKQIFERHGEAHFRDLEAATVRELCGRTDHVIALGGGAILREENREALRRSGHRIVFLDAKPQALLERIAGDPQTSSTRPDLTKLGGGIEEVRAMLDKRLPLYRQVKTDEIDVADLSVEKVAARIVQLMNVKH